MPSQLFPFKVLKAPAGAKYDEDVVGVKVPLFYLSRESYGNLFTYLPYEFRLAQLDNGMKLGEVELSKRAIRSYEFYTAEKERSHSAETHHLLLALEKRVEDAVYLNNEKLGEWMKEQTADIHRLLSSEKRYKTEAITTVVLEAEKIPKSDSILMQGLYDAERFVSLEGWVLEGSILSENAIYKDATIIQDTLSSDVLTLREFVVITSFYEAVQEAKRSGDLSGKITYGSPYRDKEATVEDILTAELKGLRESKKLELISGERDLRDSNLVQRVIYGVTNAIDSIVEKVDRFGDKFARNVLRDEQVIFGEKQMRDSLRDTQAPLGERGGKSSLIRRKSILVEKRPRRGFLPRKRFNNVVRNPKAARIDKKVKFAAKKMRDSRILVRVLFAILKHRNAYLEKKVIFAEPKITYKEGILSEVILAQYDTQEAVLQKALVYANKAGVMSELLEVILMDKHIKDAGILDMVIADGRNPGEAFIPELLEADKGEKESLLNKIISMVKAPKNSGWIEETIEAILHDTTRQAVIEYLREAEDITPEGLIEHLKSAEQSEVKEGIVSEQKLGWNKDKPNRPAGLMDTRPLGHWDIDWDDVIEFWKPGWDYLDVPETDYPYEEVKSLMYDTTTGVPHNPLSPTNVADVKITTPLVHPIPDWSDIGRDEAWVEIFTYQDCIINMLGIMRENKVKIAGMTTQQALQFMLRELHFLLDKADLLTKQYLRMFRFIRWQAETITMQESHTILRREYTDWTDGLLSTGVFNAPHTLTNAVIQPTGIIESISNNGEFKFTGTSLIDGVLTFSCALSMQPGSTGKVILSKDGTPLKTYDAATLTRDTFDVEMGDHEYSFQFQLGQGDVLRLSGFVLSNGVFKQAYSEQVDNGKTNGLRAIDLLINSLTSYYMNHHLDKSKGAVGIKQRKIWLN